MAGFLPSGRTGNHGPAAFQVQRARAARFRHFCSGLFVVMRCCSGNQQLGTTITTIGQCGCVLRQAVQNIGVSRLRPDIRAIRLPPAIVRNLPPRVRSEPFLPSCCVAANVHYCERAKKPTPTKWALKQSDLRMCQKEAFVEPRNHSAVLARMIDIQRFS